MISYVLFCFRAIEQDKQCEHTLFKRSRLALSLTSSRVLCITKKSNKSIFRMESAGVDIPDIAQKKSQN